MYGIIIAADTQILINGEAIGKPADRADALNMLSMMNGKKGMTMPNPGMTTRRANTRMNRFRRLVVFMVDPILKTCHTTYQ